MVLSFGTEMENKDFKSTFSGYSKVEVDQFIAKMMVEFNSLSRENNNLKKDNESNQEKINYYMTLEKTMQNSMEIAQKTLKFSQSQAEKAKAHADKEADHIILKAKEKAKAILDHTNEKNELLKNEYDKYYSEFETFKIRVANFIEVQKNVFSTSPEDLELSPLDFTSFEEYVLKNIADSSEEVDDDELVLPELFDDEIDHNEDVEEYDDNLIKG